MHHRLLAIIPLLLASPFLARPAHAQGDPPVLRYDLTPNRVQPADTVSVRILTALTTGVTATSATLDLSPIGLSAATPTTRNFNDFSTSFSVPTTTAAGDYPIKATILAGSTVFATPVTTLHVTTGPLLQSAAFQPDTIAPGKSTTLKAVVIPGDTAVFSLTADLSALGLSSDTLLEDVGSNTYAFLVNVSATEKERVLVIPVTFKDAMGRTTIVTASLRIQRLQPPDGLGLTLMLTPYVHPGGTVNITARFEMQCGSVSIWANLSPFGLPADYLLPGMFSGRDGAFTVPADFADGKYPIGITVNDGCGGKFTDTLYLNVTRGPIITHAAFEDDTVMPGESATISATVDPGAATSVNVTADLSGFGLSTTEPLTNYGSPAKYYRTFTVPGHQQTEPTVSVTVTDTQGRTCTATAHLSIGGLWPHLIALTASPQPIRPGQVAMLTLTPNGFPAMGASAELSAFGFPYNQNFPAFPLAPLTFTVPANATPGPYRVVAWARDEGSDVQSDSLILTVAQPVLHGDINGDGAFTMPDVLAALRIAGGLAPATDQALAAASTSASPLSTLTVSDAVRLARSLHAGS